MTRLSGGASHEIWLPNTMRNNIKGLPIFIFLCTVITVPGFSSSPNGSDDLDVTIININGGRVDWSHSGNNLIAFDRMGSDGYFDIWTMKPDGSEQVCLTRSATELPRKHIGNPVWHPCGKYIVFQAQKQNVPRRFDSKCTPGAGTLNDLWAMTADGRYFWRLHNVSTEVSKNSAGILHPHFSHDGSELIWSERIKANRRAFGEWVIKNADFIITSRGPKLVNIETINPSPRSSFYETHSFSPDDRYFLFTGNQNGGLDIYEYDLVTQKADRLTHDPKVWDEHAHYAFNGRNIIWISSRGLPIQRKPFQLKTELWMMDRDRKHKKQLTCFNFPTRKHYMEKEFLATADSSWSPDGKKLIVLLIYGDPDSRQREKGFNAIIDFSSYKE